ncbi:glycosyltransferase family 2 protein [Lacticaseibacillus pabuli]|uniref:Glycosyltransferase family 2 protein n=1 Tax=Lacticaseibacillus pabuli TaxID=3025672 RepID=A0ABY7WTQ9_9LACO|nr:glycosyltransferase family 2 protein [Lacticaseibacillus sp. KACC 23028]WDF82371.1 glycosyltransferase family 2 protein [Lacticaseibacillus sp. KACC 23028]
MKRKINLVIPIVLLIAAVLLTIELTLPNIANPVFSTLGWILTVWVYAQSFYFIFFSLFGYAPAKRNYKIIPDQTKFLIMVPAHNEQAVIETTIENLNAINYDKNLYDIYIVCDNCSDDTIKIVAATGTKYIDTSLGEFERKSVGKPGGLQYAIDKLESEGKFSTYDLTVILDADNLVDRNFLQELNSQYIGKDHPEAIQAYLDSKNVDTFLALGYAQSYWTMNRFFQLAKYRLHLPNSIGGTGYAVQNKWLQNNGSFVSESLTEDLEMEIRIVESGGRVLWNHFTRIYDEKPVKLKASLVQRTRWSKGHWYVAFHNFGRLWKLFLPSFNWKYMDQLSYLFSMRQNFLFIYLFIAAIINLARGIIQAQPISMLIGYVFQPISSSIVPSTTLNLIILLYGFIPYIAGYLMDSRRSANPFAVLKSVAAIIWFSITYVISQIAGFFTFQNQSVWSHTQHSINTISKRKKADAADIPEP